MNRVSTQRQHDGWTGQKYQSTYVFQKSSQLIQWYTNSPKHLCSHLLDRGPTAILYERPLEKKKYEPYPASTECFRAS